MALAWLACLPGAQAQPDAAAVKRLRGQVDLWLFAQENDPDGSHTWKPTFRLVQPFGLPGGWEVTLRGDIPVGHTNKVGAANQNGGYKNHVGDMLLQVSFATPPIAPHFTLGFGGRMVFPTGGKSPFGNSQYKFAPQFGFKYTLPEIAEGLTFEPLARYFHGFSPTRPRTTTAREWSIYPTVALALPDGWSVSLWYENPLIYNARTNAWFVPLDGMVWKSVSDSVQLGLGAAVRLVNADRQYKYMIYGRTTVFF
ncbi:transporter [Vineibacter terrae]|uniref:transporter n=1 Tax=Vineibacter terrae TaxID=2586908 RepID=UPI002E320375|nr:transporter [Vineibacter terrae]HEX2886909.1 transporter [Vineibacter terrae]